MSLVKISCSAKPPVKCRKRSCEYRSPRVLIIGVPAGVRWDVAIAKGGQDEHNEEEGGEET